MTTTFLPITLAAAALTLAGCATTAPTTRPAHENAFRPTRADLQRVTTAAPFPRGLVMLDDQLYVLCRGRVRGAGGVSAEVEDQAGTIYVVDPDIGEPVTRDAVGKAVRTNGRVFARPTDPPFKLWNRDARPPESDRRTDRPYCTLRYHDPTDSFYLCAFSGIDKPRQPGQASFSKNLTDAILRYDRRTQSWHEVERHDIAAGGSYPHHDVRFNAPPHGWLNGPDNCLPVQNWLYAVAKDNSRLVRYDLTPLIDDPNAGHPPSTLVLDKHVTIRGHGQQTYYGHSALAVHDGWLYIACRTSSVIFRVPLDNDGRVRTPVVGEFVARFEPFDPETLKSANLTDMDFDAAGRLYVVSAKPSRVYRFTPDPDNVFDGRTAAPWADLAALTNNPNMKSENLLVAGDRLFITSGDGYAYQAGALGTVYRLPIRD
jgi:hypothetical protein